MTAKGRGKEWNDDDDDSDDDDERENKLARGCVDFLPLIMEVSVPNV